MKRRTLMIGAVLMAANAFAATAHAVEMNEDVLPQEDTTSGIVFDQPMKLAGAKGDMGAEPNMPPRPYGSAFRTFFGDGLERNYKIGVLGWAEGSLIATDNNPGDTLLPQGFGESTLPQTFFSQTDGPVFNQLGAMVCRGDGCPPFMFGPAHNVLNRIGPTPAPRGNEIDVGFNVTVMYGEDIFFLKTKGFDDWDFDADEQNKLAVTQWFLDFYLPVADGATLMLGSFQTPLLNEIGYPFTPPNWFATHTYAFAHGPAKHVGGLAQVKIPTSPEFGLLSLEGGVVAGWNNLTSENDDPHYIFGARWRSSGMKTWIDFEAIYGNGENDSTDVIIIDGVPRPLGGGSPYLALSSNGEYLDRFAGCLVITHQLTDRLQFALEATYGYQEGGDVFPGGPVPPFVITENSTWYGVNVGLRRKIFDNLHFNARAEWFTDENAAHVLWGSVGAGGGDVYAFTANLSWEPIPFLNIRPEIRYDVYDGAGDLFAPVNPTGGAVPQAALATESEQFVGILNAVTRF
jgi:hypothetical protein